MLASYSNPNPAYSSTIVSSGSEYDKLLEGMDAYIKNTNMNNMLDFVGRNNINSANVLTTQSLLSFSNTIDVNVELVEECIQFLEVASFYSGLLYGDSNYLYDIAVNTLELTRCVESFDDSIQSEDSKEYFTTDRGVVKSLCTSNKAVVGLYLFLMFRNIFKF